MNKANLVQQIIATLEHNRSVAKAVLTATHEAATHSESRAENKYDTRGLEAAYLADGQRRRLDEIEQALIRFKTVPQHRCEVIRIGALVEVAVNDSHRWLYLGPDGAGIKIETDAAHVMVISPQAPLGALLLGKEEGDEVLLDANGRTLVYEIIQVL